MFVISLYTIFNLLASLVYSDLVQPSFLLFYACGANFAPKLGVHTTAMFVLLMVGNWGQISLVDWCSNSNFVKICQLTQVLLGRDRNMGSGLWLCHKHMFLCVIGRQKIVFVNEKLGNILKALKGGVVSIQLSKNLKKTVKNHSYDNDVGVKI